MSHRFEPDLMSGTAHVFNGQTPGYPETWYTAASKLKPFLNHPIVLTWTSRRGTRVHQATGIFIGLEGHLTYSHRGTRTILNVKFLNRARATLYSADFTVVGQV